MSRKFRSSGEQKNSSRQKHIKVRRKGVDSLGKSRNRVGILVSDKSRGPEAKFVLTEYLDRHFAVGKLSYPELFSAVFVGWSYDQAINVMGLKVADIGKHFSGRTKVYHMIGIAGSTDIRPLSFATAFRWSQIINIEFSKLIVTVQNKLDDEIKRRGLDLKP